MIVAFRFKNRPNGVRVSMVGAGLRRSVMVSDGLGRRSFHRFHGVGEAYGAYCDACNAAMCNEKLYEEVVSEVVGHEIPERV